MRIAVVTVLAGLLAACGGGDGGSGDGAARAAGDTGQAAAPSETGAARRVAQVEGGFSTPESVIYDPDQDVWFVANIDGDPTAKDGKGFISRLRGDGTIDSLRFIDSGVRGVRLDAPKGQAIVGDTLWVADIDVVRGFHRRTGAPVATIEFSPAPRFLNDVAAGPDGSLYVTDTGIRFKPDGGMEQGPGRVYRVGPKRRVTVVAEGTNLDGPNGITWDRAAGRFVVVGFTGPGMFRMAPDSAPVAWTKGPGQHDGVEVLDDGRVLVSSWTDSTVFVASDGGNQPVIRGVPSPADIGLDRKTNRVAVPIFTGNRVEIWQLP